MRVHVLGSAVLDALCGPIQAYPIPKVKTQVNAERIEFQPGGGAVNTSLALAQLGVEVGIFTRVGADMSGRSLKDTIARRGVDITGLALVEGGTTPFTFVGIHPGGDRSFVHTPGVNLQTQISDFDARRLLGCGLLCYQDLFVQPQMDGQPAAKLLQTARKQGIITVLDECFGLGPRRDWLEPVLPHLDYFLPSFDDLKTIYPDATPATLPAHLHGLGVKTVVLKMGPAGCIVSHGGKVVARPSQAQKVVDTTGAGDCFDAGFIAGITHGLDPFAAADLGAATAAACIAHVGGANGIPSFAALTAASSSR